MLILKVNFKIIEKGKNKFNVLIDESKFRNLRDEELV